MEDRIARFVSGLRASGVRVSIAESQDAWRAIQLMGTIDRETFRLSLQSTLIKDAVNIPIFEELFPLYFGVDQPPLLNPEAELSADEKQMLQQALQSLAQDLQELLSWLMSGQSPSQEELEDLAQQAGMEQASSPYQARWYARRMQRLLGWEQMQQVLEMLWEWLAEQGMDPETLERLKQQVGSNQETLAEQLEQFAGRQVLDNLADQQHERRQNVHDLMNRPFKSLSETEMDVLREQVRRLAARLRSRAALRQKRGKRGKLDPKATIRASQRYYGVPLELKLRRRRQKPKLVVILDVSTSMRPVAEFFLRLMYLLQDQVQKTRSFAFIDHLEEVTNDMKSLGVEGAVDSVLHKLPQGYYNTDLGASLRNFASGHMDSVDSRTTVIVLGDGRNNYKDPGLSVFGDVKRRSRRLIWMNPEYPAQWGTGDSDMLQYAPLCSDVYQVRNLTQLTDAVDRILSS
ncbi:MAG: VWA domain-containing protein [Chloroflexota bacterium]